MKIGQFKQGVGQGFGGQCGQALFSVIHRFHSQAGKSPGGLNFREAISGRNRILYYDDCFDGMPAFYGGSSPMSETELLQRITGDPEIFSGKPVIRGRWLAVEYVLGMPAAGDDFETLLEGYPWLEREDILACLAYAHRLIGHERVEPAVI
jgi:uncharacterized protein (DUF433 family)